MTPALAEAVESPTAVAETDLPPETPGSPELSSTEAAAVEAAPPASDAPVRTRDPATGRFIKADGSQVSDAEQATLEAKEPPAAVVASPPPVTETTTAKADPFIFRGDGQRYPIPGATVSADGTLTIPADQVPNVRQLLAEGVAHRGSWREQQQQAKAATETATATEKARAEKYNAAAVLLWDHLTNPEWLAAAVQSPERLEILRERLEVALQRSDLSVPKGAAPAATDVATDDPRLEQSARAALEEEVELLLEGPAARGFYTPEQRTALLKQYQRRLNAYFVEHEGQVVLDRHVLAEDFADELAQRQALRGVGDADRKAKEFNARRNQPPAPAVPVVSPRGPGGSGTGAGRIFKDKEEYRKAMGLS